MILPFTPRVKNKGWLRQALKEGRARGYMYTMHLSLFRKMLEANSLTLSDVGTSEDELEQFRVNGLKDLAKEILSDLRDEHEPNLDPDRDIVRMQKCLEEAGLTLADIGTDEDELSRFHIPSSLR